MPPVKTFIVEDNPLIRENLVAALLELAEVQLLGHAEDEASAVQWLQQRRPCDLLIIDIFLRSGSGLGVLRAAAEQGSTARRVVLTNYATEDMRRHCRALGANRIFDKSRELDELLAYCSDLAAGGTTAPVPLGPR
jgi:DNA-binding NarL/FixJ family response regulator